MGSSVTEQEIVAGYPTLYHMTEEANVEGIRKRGLLSTSALLDLYEYSGTAREPIEARRRPSAITIMHPHYGAATIRDNAPLSDKLLARCLTDMSVEDWYRHLN